MKRSLELFIIHLLFAIVLFTSTAMSNPQCPPGFTGYLEYPDNCYKFLQCDRGSTFVINCGPGTAFNPWTNVCDWPENVPSCYVDGEGTIDIR
ncbi:peritrophin-1-like [Fopius arisanus]|uniref:Peritrophin-1-like n=1 Tax=Fopius arisanus TaxID=64838 RepID=A0A9R1U2A0_9HYME|nr:PREDICTED: peritrophin-1-like [Fopius arisanus]